MVIFTYNFRHRKSSDFIIACLINNIKIDLIIASPKKQLKVQKSVLRSKIKSDDIFEPLDIAKRFNLNYIVADHNSNLAADKINELKPDIGLIAGARILKKNIIDKFKIGVVNFHPGDIPKIRGLNSILKTIKLRERICVTSHLIDEKIDLGWIIEKQYIKMDMDDTIFDITQKVYKLQIEMIKSTLLLVEEKKYHKIESLNTVYDSEFPYDNLSEFNIDFDVFKKIIIK